MSDAVELHLLGNVVRGTWPEMVLVGVLLLVPLGWSLLWLANDAHERGKNPIIAMLFGPIAAWPLSLLGWCWLRPDRTRAATAVLPGTRQHINISVDKHGIQGRVL